MLRPLVYAVIALAIAHPRAAHAENGSDLWLRYRPLPEATRASYASAIRTNRRAHPVADGRRDCRGAVAGTELLGRDVPRADGADAAGALIKGYQAWADALKPVLTRLLGPRGKTDSAPPPTGDPSAIGPRQPGR